MVNHHRAAVLAVLLLIVTGAVCVGLRIKCMSKPALSQGGDTWRLTYNVEFLANKPGARLHIAIPSDTAFANIVNESFSHKKLVVDMLQNKETGDREAIAVASECSTPSKFTARFDLSISTDPKRSVYSSKKSLGTPEKLRYLRNERFIQKDDPNVVRVLTNISDGKKTKVKLVEGIFDYCSESLAQSQSKGPTDAVTVLQQGQCDALGRARAMVALCRAGRIPSRLVTGFILESSSTAKPFTWVEIYHKKTWIPYDPHNGFSLQLPANYLPVRRGGIRIVKSSGGLKRFSAYTIEQLDKMPLMAMSSNIKFWYIFDLTRLPISMKKTLSLILLLPTGALITAFFRNLIGIRTFGTFTPTLLALSLVNLQGAVKLAQAISNSPPRHYSNGGCHVSYSRGIDLRILRFCTNRPLDIIAGSDYDNDDRAFFHHTGGRWQQRCPESSLRYYSRSYLLFYPASFSPNWSGCFDFP
jgi:hypothetical protein